MERVGSHLLCRQPQQLWLVVQAYGRGQQLHVWIVDASFGNRLHRIWGSCVTLLKIAGISWHLTCKTVGKILTQVRCC